MTDPKTFANLFKNIVDCGPDAIIIVDKIGLIFYANKRVKDYFQYEPEELHAQPIEVLIPEELRSSHEKARQQYMKNPVVRPMASNLELTGLRKDKSTIPVEISLAPIHEGDETAFIATIRDQSHLKTKERELKKLNDKLSQSNKELKRFAYIASHDLQEPLRTIDAYCKLLGQQIGPKMNNAAKESFTEITASVKRSRGLINDLLSYSRLSIKAKELEKTSLDLVVDHVKHNLASSIKENSVVIKSSPLPEVLGDFPQLTQLFQNLISNAIKFNRETPPEIVINTKEQGEFWAISVADNGIGIDLKYQQLIFDIFQRLHNQDEYEGTGIGLAICKKVIDRHGGTISVDSQPGKGSTFTFTLQKPPG